MKKGVKIFSKIILGILLFIVALAFILPLFFKRQIIHRTEKAINEKISGKVRFRDIHVSMFRNFPDLTVTVSNLTVVGVGEFKGETLCSMKELLLGINLPGLILNQKTELKSVTLESPFINLRVLKNGNANYSIVASDSTASDTTTGFQLALDKIIIHNGTLVYEDKTSATYIEMHQIEHVGKGDFMNDVFDYATNTDIGELTYDYGRIRYLDRKKVKVDLAMEMNMKDDRFTFKENLIQINHFKFGLEGSFGFSPTGYLMDLKYATTETAFKNILSLIPGVYMEDLKQIKTSGDLVFNGFVKGEYSDSLDRIPSFHSEIKLIDGSFQVDTLPLPVKNMNLNLELDNQYGILDSTVIDLKDFRMDVGTHPVHGRIKWLGLGNNKVDADIHANLDLADLQKIYPIKHVSLNGKVNLEFKAKGAYIQKEKLEAIPAFQLSLKVVNGMFKYDSLPSSIKNIHFDLVANNRLGKLEATSANINKIHLEMGKNPLDGYIHLTGYENYKVDASLNSTIDLADVEKMFPVKGILLKGMLRANAKVAGVYNAVEKKFPMVDANLNVSDGWIKSESYPEPVEGIHMIAEIVNQNGNSKDTKLTIKQLTYNLENEPFQVSGSVSDPTDLNYDLTIDGKVDLEKITKIYPVSGYTLKGIIDSDFKIKAKNSDIEEGKYRRIKTGGTIAISNLWVNGSSLKSPLSVEEAIFNFTSTKVVLEKMKGAFGKSKISMKGDLTNYLAFLPKNPHSTYVRDPHKKRKPIVGDLIFECDTLDLNDWLAVPETSSNVNTVNVSANTKTKSTNIHALWRVPERWDFTFDSKIGYVRYQDLHITEMDGEIRVKDGVLTMTETGFNTLNAKFIVTGDYDTRNMDHPIFDFFIDIKELDINRAYKEVKLFRDLVPAAADASGIFSINYKLKGELANDMGLKYETLLGGGEVRIQNAVINGMKIFEEISKTAKKENINDPHLKDFVMDTEIKNGKVYVKPFSLEISGFDADVEGVNGFDGTIQYIFKLELLPIQKLKIPFHVTGTYDNPKVALGKGHKLPE